MSDTIKKVRYKYIANEYYDSNIHPTCNNFREASKGLLKLALQNFDKNKSLNCLEVGSGKSVFAELIDELNLNINSLIISDLEKEMLEYSKIYKDKWTLKVTDATNTDLDSSSYDLVISSLGDPYNTDDFWKEVHRLLNNKGKCLFTTPSFEWSQAFRKEHIDFAEFVDKNSVHVYVPSFIYQVEAQKELLEKNGLKITETKDIRLKEVNFEMISPKLNTSQGENLPIVTLYQIEKNN